MPTDNTRTDRGPAAEFAYRFLVGTVFGLVVASLPALLISLSAMTWQASYLVALAGLAGLCGVLGAVWGDRFFEKVAQFLESVPPIF